MGPKTCKVCENAQSKYKCPTCLIPYCSLLCFKKHKACSSEIREALKDEELQKLICCIDGSADAKTIVAAIGS